jgi:hypothetical protein
VSSDKLFMVCCIESLIEAFLVDKGLEGYWRFSELIFILELLLPLRDLVLD